MADRHAAPGPGAQARAFTQEWSLATPILFFGKKSSTRDGVTAEKFIKEMEARKTKYNWSNQETLTYFISCLRDEAANWWESTVELDIDYCEIGNGTHATENWEAAKAVFRDHYGLAGRTFRLWFKDNATQRSGEDVQAYIQRAGKQIVTFLHDNTEDAITDFIMPARMHNMMQFIARDNVRGAWEEVPIPGRPEPDRADNEAPVELAAGIRLLLNQRANRRGADGRIEAFNVEEHMDEVRGLINTAFNEASARAATFTTRAADYALAEQKKIVRVQVTRFLQSHLVLEGIANKDVRLYAKELLEKPREQRKSYRVICDLVGKKANSKAHLCVNEVDIQQPAEEEAPTAPASVDAAAAKKKKEQDAKAKAGREKKAAAAANKSSAGGANKRNTNEHCTFCNITGHTDAKCRQKKFIMNNKKKIAQLMAVDAEVETISAQQASGNDNRRWE